MFFIFYCLTKALANLTLHFIEIRLFAVLILVNLKDSNVPNAGAIQNATKVSPIQQGVDPSNCRDNILTNVRPLHSYNTCMTC